MTLRYKLLAVLIILVSVFLYGRCSRPNAPQGKPNSPAVLPPNDLEEIIVDPVKHTLIVVKPTGNQTMTLPDHQSVIDFHKDGSVKITSPQSGLEHRFFFGIQGSNMFLVAAGMDGAYFKKLDVGLGVADGFGEHTPIVFAQVSYNFYSNCRIGLTYGMDRLIGGSITVRL